MTQQRAVARVEPTSAEITKILQDMGALEPPIETNRVKIDGTTFYFGDEPYVSNPRTGEPAFRARIADAPTQYQALWIDDAAAAILDRPSMAGRFCKSHFAEPQQARERAEDGTSCRTCPANPFTKDSPLENGRHCQWKGDLSIQLVDPETGQLKDQNIWTLTLPTTGMIEWQGVNRAPQAGNVSEFNFMHQLAKIGAAAKPDDVVGGIQAAVNALALGLVVADFRIIRASANGKNWSVPSATPVQVLDFIDEEPQRQLPAETGRTINVTDEGVEQDNMDDLPF